MNESHVTYLSLGSNLQPEVNLIDAIHLLRDYARIEKVSSAWESKSVGAVGPNYLNACVLLATSFEQAELKRDVLLPIEIELGRKRSENKFAPRTIDIDIVLFDNRSCDDKYWEQAFVVIPLAEIYPDYENPLTHESIIETAMRLRKEIWIEARRGVLSQFDGNHLAA
jgi:2-amino-4-hydroxy-6-hydroxymethyldihydropteridine diphosphokinase